MEFPGGSLAKNLPADAGDARDMGLIPGSGRSLGHDQSRDQCMISHVISA